MPNDDVIATHVGDGGGVHVRRLELRRPLPSHAFYVVQPADLPPPNSLCPPASIGGRPERVPSATSGGALGRRANDDRDPSPSASRESACSSFGSTCEAS